MRGLEGGERRRDSVKAGLDTLQDVDYLVVHDGARPLVTTELIEAAVRGAEKTGAAPVRGNLYVLSVGISRYHNADGKGFKDLTYPAVDAKAIAERFQAEGHGLYGR